MEDIYTAQPKLLNIYEVSRGTNVAGVAWLSNLHTKINRGSNLGD